MILPVLTGFQNARHFLYILALVRHVLSRFASPNKIELVVFMSHVQSVHDRKPGVGDAFGFCKLCGAPHLIWRERNPWATRLLKACLLSAWSSHESRSS